MKKAGIFAVLALPAACTAILFSSSLRPFLQLQRNETDSLQTFSSQQIIAGDLAQGIIDNTDGFIAEQTVRNTVYGFSLQEHSVNRYYVFALPDGKLMLYETGRQQDYEQLSRLADACETYHDALLKTAERDGRKADLIAVKKPELTVQVTGVIRKMPVKVRNIFSNWYGKAYTGRFSEACETAYLLVQTDASAIHKNACISGLCAVLTCILLAAAGILHRREKRNQQ